MLIDKYKRNILKNIDNYLIYLIILLGLFLRLYKLDNIPAEIWGDIVEGMDFMTPILEGKFPFHYVLGNGPIFFYIASLFSLIVGFNFLALKVTSVVFGLLLVFGGYLFARELFNKEIALITAFLLAVSKWPVIYSRLGLMNIMIPTVISYIFYFLLKSINNKNPTFLLYCSLLLGLGLYIYPAFIIVPPVFFLTLIIFALNKDFKKILPIKKYLMVSLIVFFLLSTPFILSFDKFGFGDTNSYFGSKFLVASGTLAPDFINRFYSNIVKHLLMFNYKGDACFRINPTNSPQLDLVSGIFFIVGIIYLLFSNIECKKKFLLFIPLIAFQLPSLLVLNVPTDVPSATRSIGIIPFLYVIIALGINFIIGKADLIQKNKKLFLTIIFSCITILNIKQVFVDYSKGLPHKNTPFGRIIADKIDGLTYGIQPYVYSCCWGDWGQPEPGGITYALKRTRDINFIPRGENLCLYLPDDTDYYLILDPNYKHLLKDGLLCGFKIDHEEVVSKYNDVVFIGVWNY